MPNGRNAGRLFADCTGEHGYGESHSVVMLDGSPVQEKPPKETIEVRCDLCDRHFLLDPAGVLSAVAGWRERLQAELLDLFRSFDISVGVGLTKDGVALRSQDKRVDAANLGNVRAFGAETIEEGPDG